MLLFLDLKTVKLYDNVWDIFFIILSIDNEVFLSKIRLFNINLRLIL